MSLNLPEILTLVGRLDDSPGFDTPRERFRRFINERVTDIPSIRILLAQCQLGLGDQFVRARQDLIIVLGRFLGFEVTFGGYEPGGSTRLEGHWRSRRQARVVIEVRSEQTTDADVEDLVRSVAALSASAPADVEERWVGLCVTTPFYAARRRLEALLVQRDPRDIRCVTVESLLWLAEMAVADRIAHGDALRLLTSGPDSDFMIDLMRRLTDGNGGAQAAVPDAHPSRPVASEIPSPPLSIVGKPERERETTRFWLAVLTQDENASPEQFLDSVISGRQVIGISEAGPFVHAAQPGDWACFLIAGTGIVGHAQFDTLISDASALIRGARRFTAVFHLRHVAIYDVPNVIDPGSEAQRIVNRMPLNASGAFLAVLPRAEYESLTTSARNGARQAGL